LKEENFYLYNQARQLAQKETKAQQSETEMFQAANGNVGFFAGRKNSRVFPIWILIIAASAKSPRHTKPYCQLGSTSQKSK